MTKPHGTAPSRGRAAALAWAAVRGDRDARGGPPRARDRGPASRRVRASNPEVPGGGVPVRLRSRGPDRARVIGAVVASRQPRNPVGWILCVDPALAWGFSILGVHAFWSLASTLAGSGGRRRARGMALELGLDPGDLRRRWSSFPLLFPTGASLDPSLAPGRVGRRSPPCARHLRRVSPSRPGEFEDLPGREPGRAEATTRSRRSEVAQRPRLPLLVARGADRARSPRSSCASVVRGAIERQQLKWVHGRRRAVVLARRARSSIEATTSATRCRCCSAS